MKVRYLSGALPAAKTFKPNFLLDHCTFEGAGLFDLTNSPGPSRRKVEVRQCVLRANTLLAVNPKRAPPKPDRLAW